MTYNFEQYIEGDIRLSGYCYVSIEKENKEVLISLYGFRIEYIEDVHITDKKTQKRLGESLLRWIDEKEIQDNILKEQNY